MTHLRHAVRERRRVGVVKHQRRRRRDDRLNKELGGRERALHVREGEGPECPEEVEQDDDAQVAHGHVTDVGALHAAGVMHTRMQRAAATGKHSDVADLGALHAAGVTTRTQRSSGRVPVVEPVLLQPPRPLERTARLPRPGALQIDPSNGSLCVHVSDTLTRMQRGSGRSWGRPADVGAAGVQGWRTCAAGRRETQRSSASCAQYAAAMAAAASGSSSGMVALKRNAVLRRFRASP